MPISEFGHLSGIFKPSEHPRSFTTGTFATGNNFCIHSSHRFAELRVSIRNTLLSLEKSHCWRTSEMIECNIMKVLIGPTKI